MCLGPTASLRYIPMGLLGGYGEVCVLQAESLKSWNDGGKHYYLNLRQRFLSPQVQEKINTPFLLWSKQAQREEACSHDLLQNLLDEVTFHNFGRGILEEGRARILVKGRY